MKLLVSVRDVKEADIAVAAGADWIDFKEPLAGALGPVAASIAATAVDSVERRCRISAALGELSEWQTSSDLLSIPGIDVVKLGLAGCGQLADWQSCWTKVFEICRHFGKNLAAVAYADWQAAAAPHPDAILECGFRAGANYLLIDTFDKQGLSSIEVLGRDKIASFLDLARGRGMVTALAGKLCANDLATAAQLPIDIIAIRGAACLGGRDSPLDGERICRFRKQLEISVHNARKLNACLTAYN